MPVNDAGFSNFIILRVLFTIIHEKIHPVTVYSSSIIK